MIYDYPASQDDIQQGDIFFNIPRVEVEFSDGLSVISKSGELLNISWEEAIHKDEEVCASFGIFPVPAIVATQNCDAQTDDYLTLFEIVEASDTSFFKELKDKPQKNQVKGIIENNRKMLGVFYLPKDEKVGFTSRRVVLFSNTIRILRKDLDKFKMHRKGRLNKIAYEHFREKVSHYFHRYAWNDWYVLDKLEVKEYKYYSSLSPEDLYGWQKG